MASNSLTSSILDRLKKSLDFFLGRPEMPGVKPSTPPTIPNIETSPVEKDASNVITLTDDEMQRVSKMLSDSYINSYNNVGKAILSNLELPSLPKNSQAAFHAWRDSPESKFQFSAAAYDVELDKNSVNTIQEQFKNNVGNDCEELANRIIDEAYNEGLMNETKSTTFVYADDHFQVGVQVNPELAAKEPDNTLKILGVTNSQTNEPLSQEIQYTLQKDLSALYTTRLNMQQNYQPHLSPEPYNSPSYMSEEQRMVTASEMLDTAQDRGSIQFERAGKFQYQDHLYSVDAELRPNEVATKPEHSVQINTATFRDEAQIKDFTPKDKNLMEKALSTMYSAECRFRNEVQPNLSEQTRNDLFRLGVDNTMGHKNLMENGSAQSKFFFVDNTLYQTDKPFEVRLKNNELTIHDGTECTVDGFFHGLSKGYTEVFNEGSENERHFQKSVGNGLSR